MHQARFGMNFHHTLFRPQSYVNYDFGGIGRGMASLGNSIFLSNVINTSICAGTNLISSIIFAFTGFNPNGLNGGIGAGPYNGATPGTPATTRSSDDILNDMKGCLTLRKYGTSNPKELKEGAKAQKESRQQTLQKAKEQYITKKDGSKYTYGELRAKIANGDDVKAKALDNMFSGKADGANVTAEELNKALQGIKQNPDLKGMIKESDINNLEGNAKEALSDLETSQKQYDAAVEAEKMASKLTENTNLDQKYEQLKNELADKYTGVPNSRQRLQNLQNRKNELDKSFPKGYPNDTNLKKRDRNKGDRIQVEINKIDQEISKLQPKIAQADAEIVQLEADANKNPIFISSSTPVAGKTPEAEKTPETGKTPEAGKTSETGKTPEAGKTPETGKTPESGKTPEAVTTPDQTEASDKTKKTGKTGKKQDNSKDSYEYGGVRKNMAGKYVDANGKPLQQPTDEILKDAGMSKTEKAGVFKHGDDKYIFRNGEFLQTGLIDTVYMDHDKNKPYSKKYRLENGTIQIDKFDNKGNLTSRQIRDESGNNIKAVNVFKGNKCVQYVYDKAKGVYVPKQVMTKGKDGKYTTQKIATENGHTVESTAKSFGFAEQYTPQQIYNV